MAHDGELFAGELVHGAEDGGAGQRGGVSRVRVAELVLFRAAHDGDGGISGKETGRATAIIVGGLREEEGVGDRGWVAGEVG